MSKGDCTAEHRYHSQSRLHHNTAVPAKERTAICYCSDMRKGDCTAEHRYHSPDHSQRAGPYTVRTPQYCCTRETPYSHLICYCIDIRNGQIAPLAEHPRLQPKPATPQLTAVPAKDRTAIRYCIDSPPASSNKHCNQLAVCAGLAAPQQPSVHANSLSSRLTAHHLTLSGYVWLQTTALTCKFTLLPLVAINIAISWLYVPVWLHLNIHGT